MDRMSALIVERDESTRVLLRRAIEADKWTVMEASTGEAACNLLRGVRGPLVVVLDYDQPANETWRILWYALEEPLLNQRCAFILMTSQAQRLLPVFHLALKRLSLQVLLKPFTAEQAQATLQHATVRVQKKLAHAK